MAKSNFQGSPMSCVTGAAVELGDILQLDATNNWPYAIKTAADTDVVIGVALNAAASGEVVQVGVERGVYTLRASAAITEEAKVCATSDGEIKAAASGDEAFGIALDAASAADDEIRVLCFIGTQLLA